MDSCRECYGYLYYDNVCEDCGLVNDAVYAYDYTDEKNTDMVRKIVYSRNTYFDDLLSYLTVDDNKYFDFTCIKSLVDFCQIENLEDVTYTELLYHLKKFNKFNKKKIPHNHIYRIYYYFTKKKLIHINQKQKTQIEYIFYYFEIEYCKQIDYIRDNFDIKLSIFNYQFIISKIFEIVELDHYNKYLKEVKCKKNIIKYNKIWNYVYQRIVEFLFV